VSGKILTIVVPSYNTEKYIDFCLPTMLENEKINYQMEILLVDDGSKDNTLKKALDYQSKYPNVVKAIAKDNGGHGSTINAGLEIATGKYFKVIDGDDWVDNRGLTKLVDFLSNTNNDIVFTPYTRIDVQTGDKIIESDQGFDYCKTYDFDEIASLIKKYCMHSITIKTSVLKKNKRKISERCFYVDLEYIFFPIQNLYSAAFLPDNVYMYRVGQSLQSTDLKNMQKNILQHRQIVLGLKEYYFENSTQLSNFKQKFMMNLLKDYFVYHWQIIESFSNPKEARKHGIEFDNGIRSLYSETNIGRFYIYRKTNYFFLYFVKFKYTEHKL